MERDPWQGEPRPDGGGGIVNKLPCSAGLHISRAFDVYCQLLHQILGDILILEYIVHMLGKHGLSVRPERRNAFLAQQVYQRHLAACMVYVASYRGLSLDPGQPCFFQSICQIHIVAGVLLDYLFWHDLLCQHRQRCLATTGHGGCVIGILRHPPDHIVTVESSPLFYLFLWQLGQELGQLVGITFDRCICQVFGILRFGYIQ